MNKNLLILWIFYKKLILPAGLFSLLFYLLLQSDPETFGLSFLLILPLLHYFIYELRLKNEYYFYAHFGFSRLFLWITTVLLGVTVKIITFFL